MYKTTRLMAALIGSASLFVGADYHIAGNFPIVVPAISSIPGGCGNTIYMDESITRNIPNWKLENSRYITQELGRSTDPLPDERQISCQHNHILINLDSFNKTRGPKELAQWLKTNGKFICYEKTGPIIECEHRVFDRTLVKYINNVRPTRTWTVGKLKEKIEREGLTDFNSCTYENYFSFRFYAVEADINILEDFDDDENCFSIPLIKSIISRHGLDDSSELEIRRVSINGTRKIFISPKAKGCHYDFSQYPTLSSSTEFSPL